MDSTRVKKGIMIMMTFNNLADRIDRSVMETTKSTDDGASMWKIRLAATDFPAQFAKSENRDINVQIVDLEDIQVGDASVMFLPVELAGISTIGQETRYHYRQRFTTDEGKSIAPSLTLDGFITTTGTDKKPIKNPFMRIEFTVNNELNRDAQTHQATTDYFAAARDLKHVDANENSNGGLDLKAGEQKSDEAERQREIEASKLPQELTA